jgi:hypothetical protein
MGLAPRLLIAAILTGMLSGPDAEAEEPLGDKALHVLFGASCALLASAAAAPALQELPASDVRYALRVAGYGLGAAAGAGALKELLDLMGLGDPEWLDLAASLAGGLAAAAAVFGASAADRQAAPRLACAYASFAVVLALPPAAQLLKRPRRASRSGS